jgi:hypothetical protein
MAIARQDESLDGPGGVAQWASHPPQKQKTRVRIPPGYKVKDDSLDGVDWTDLTVRQSIGLRNDRPLYILRSQSYIRSQATTPVL